MGRVHLLRSGFGLRLVELRLAEALKKCPSAEAQKYGS